MKTFLTAFIIHATIMIFIASTWVVNLVKLTRCDFQPSYKDEIIHAIGIIPPCSVITVWFQVENTKP